MKESVFGNGSFYDFIFVYSYSKIIRRGKRGKEGRKTRPKGSPVSFCRLSQFLQAEIIDRNWIICVDSFLALQLSVAFCPRIGIFIASTVIFVESGVLLAVPPALHPPVGHNDKRLLWSPLRVNIFI